MTAMDLYSVRMRASLSELHLSGGERLVPRERIDRTVQELVRRAMGKEYLPDKITMNIDALGSAPIGTLTSLDLTALAAAGLTEFRDIAACLLSGIGISRSAVDAAVRALDRGASPDGGNMRGAMLIDASTGERLEPDHARGVRVSRFDWSDDASLLADRALAGLGLTHFRTKEALALATKVAHAPGVIAELCWSDDPDYTAGYVASRSTGYVRLQQMKQAGSSLGGRAFFVRSADLDRDALIAYLEGTPVLITSIGVCRTGDTSPCSNKN